MSSPIRNRIKAHRRVRAGDLVPHELNFRLYPDRQRSALYEAVGFARSLLAYELPDGRPKLLDGHLGRDLEPDMEVEVEILDANDEEAQALLLSIDPLAALAETQDQLHRRLLELAPPVPEDLQAAAAASLKAVAGSPSPEAVAGLEQFLVLATYRDDKHQVKWLQRLQGEGVKCKALLA